jgi:hypothetical protein
MGKKERSLYFAFLLYQESAPSDWLDTLSGFHVPALVSPLHDNDMHDDGTQKKPHWHIILMFPTVKSIPQVIDLLSPFGIHHVEVVHSRKVYTRYLCHLDDPDKALYSENDVLCISGATYDTTPDLTADDIVRLKLEIQRFCRENTITEYSDLCHYCDESGRSDWFRVVTSTTIHWRAYFASLRHR